MMSQRQKHIVDNLGSLKNMSVPRFLQKSKNAPIHAYNPLQIPGEINTSGNKTPTTFIRFYTNF